jgi:flagellin-like hook-associated protein FlgL
MADDSKSSESREEIVAEFNERRQEVQSLVQKITQLDGDRMEHE